MLFALENSRARQEVLSEGNKILPGIIARLGRISLGVSTYGAGIQG